MELNLTINTNDIEGSFDRIANELLNEWILEVNDSKYRIEEIEFYLANIEHNDTYTHRHALQKTTGKWYFHGSGIDLTCGTAESHGGILIRAIYNTLMDTYIYGPLKTVTELFSNLKTAHSSPVQFGLKSDTDKSLTPERVFKAPRVGLNPKKDKEAFNQNYRYFIMPKEEHKGKTIIYEALLAQGFSESEARIIRK
ncbi:MAG: hypothetical protein AAGA66_07415 [Bacteroidota bacterium]